MIIKTNQVSEGAMGKTMAPFLERSIIMLDQYTIGELSKKTGLSIHTIRYYDNIDLLKPSSVDEETGYRYYTVHDFWCAEVISMFRSIDMPIEEIKEIMKTQDYRKVRDALNHRQKKIKEVIEKYRQADKDIRWFKHMLGEQNKQISETTYIREIKPRIVVYKKNKRSEREYHMTLQNISVNELQHAKSLQRKYGYIINSQIIMNNAFKIEGEYLDLYKDNYEYTEDKYVYEIPGGVYLCQKVRVLNKVVDMSHIRKAIRESGYRVEMIVAEEIGLPLFNFDDLECEMQLLLSNK